jgi:hypothetical protein
LPPTRVKVPSWSTRSSLTWLSSGISPISSRKSVPVSANLELALLLLHRAGEGAALVAEQLALEQFMRGIAAVLIFT